MKVFSTDEKSGIQALEHICESIPLKQGQIERYEQEYPRHRTTTIIASRNVANGQIINLIIQSTRTEVNFAEHIKQIITQDTKTKHIFIMDQLNTHKSENLAKKVKVGY